MSEVGAGQPGRPGRHVRVRLMLRVLLVVVLLMLLHEQGLRLVDWLESQFQAVWASWGLVFVVGAFLLYIVLLALPFVPGTEIGWTLMVLFGAKGVVMVYLATVLSLSLSFLIGRRCSLGALAGCLSWLHLHRAGAFVRHIAQLPDERKLAVLVDDAPLRAIPFLVRHRHLAIAVAFNLPGNALIGGGGGIGLLAGMSGLFRFRNYLVTVCLAVAPIPFIILASSGVPWLLE